MIELTQKQAEYVEFVRKTIVDPDMVEFALLMKRWPNET